MSNRRLTFTIAAIALVAAILLGGRINPEPDPRTTASADTTPAQHHPQIPNHPTSTAPTPAGHEQTTTPAVAEGDPGVTGTPVATPSHDGGEDPTWEPDETAQQQAIDTATTFVTGWLTDDTETRTTLLAPVTAPALLETLLTPGIKTWNTTPAGSPTITQLAATNAQLHQTFTDGRAIDMLLIAEPAAPHGWSITDVQPARS